VNDNGRGVSVRPPKRTALVTRGNSGIDLAIARALGLAGAGLILVRRRARKLADAAAALSSLHRSVKSVCSHTYIRKKAETDPARTFNKTRANGRSWPKAERLV
jgi:NAD(P)-dependent dehydrogenase (short-subunit alcohol dehydrogenase family)